MSEVKAITPIDEVKNMLQKMSQDFTAALPEHVTVEKFTRVVITSLRLNPTLLDANRLTLYASAMQCAQDGLLPDGREAAFVPFKGNVKYMPMVGGICKKARNSGEILNLDAVVVYEKDEYSAWVDENGQHFKFVKSREADRGKHILTFAYATTKDGGLYFEEIDEKQMQAIEAMSTAGTSPWKGAFKDEMRRKSAIRRLCKYRLPSSTDLDDLVRQDDEFYDVDPEPKKPEEAGTPTRLKSAMGVNQQASVQQPPAETENREVPL